MLFALLHIKNYIIRQTVYFLKVLQNKHNMTIYIRNCEHWKCSTEIVWIVDFAILMFSEITEIEIHSNPKLSA